MAIKNKSTIRCDRYLQEKWHLFNLAKNNVKDDVKSLKTWNGWLSRFYDIKTSKFITSHSDSNLSLFFSVGIIFFCLFGWEFNQLNIKWNWRVISSKNIQKEPFSWIGWRQVRTLQCLEMYTCFIHYKWSESVLIYDLLSYSFMNHWPLLVKDLFQSIRNQKNYRHYSYSE